MNNCLKIENKWCKIKDSNNIWKLQHYALELILKEDNQRILLMSRLIN